MNSNKMSLRAKLVTLFLLVGLAPLLVIGLVSYFNSRDSLRSELLSSIGQLGQGFNQMSESLNELFKKAADTAENVNQSSESLSSSVEATSSSLEQFKYS